MTEITTVKTVSMTTVEIAKQTGKEHRNVIRDARKMFESLEISPLSFERSIKDARGKVRKCYNLPKREVLILVSGYSIKLRAAIIDKLEELEKEADTIGTLSPTELIIQSAQALLVVEQEQSKIKARLAIVEARQCTDPGYFSITAYANITKTQVDTRTAKHLGKQATQLSKDNGLSVDKTPHERWGYVNTYSEKVLKKVFASYRDLFI
jgi:phage regulator Rha-like protein